MGQSSDPEMLAYTWEMVRMTSRTLELAINFANTIYVSAEEDPEQLEITINSGKFFVSAEGAPLLLPSQREIQFRALQTSDSDESYKYLVLTQRIPK